MRGTTSQTIFGGKRVCVCVCVIHHGCRRQTHMWSRSSHEIVKQKPGAPGSRNAKLNYDSLIVFGRGTSHQSSPVERRAWTCRTQTKEKGQRGRPTELRSDRSAKYRNLANWQMDGWMDGWNFKWRSSDRCTLPAVRSRK